MGESAESSGFLGRKGAGISASNGCTMLNRTASDILTASSSVAGALDRELAVLSVNSSEPYEEAESTDARFESVGLSAIEVDVGGAGGIAPGLFHSKSKIIVSAGLGGSRSVLDPAPGCCKPLPLSGSFMECFRSSANGSRAICAGLGVESVYGVNGAWRGDSKAEDEIGGVGCSFVPSLKAACTISLLEETDRDLLRPKILVILRPRLEPELGWGAIGDFARNGRPSGPNDMLLTMGAGAFAL